MKILENNNIELLVRVSLGILFFYSSLHKIGNPAEFAKVIYGYSLFPHSIINIFAISVPFLELFAGLSLIIGVYPKSGVMIINIMLSLFIIAISINLIRGHEFDCGCVSFGEPQSVMSNIWVLIRDIFCLLFGVYILYFRDDNRKLCIKK
ncbi:MAG: DoxX family membrane protein [Desulfobacterales bacterium]|nr:DoxX family membrane protein [Desulfobacterales bacterium]MCP4160078.1 DoxX family membrane protein [Deltaproteobacteria bacterium]